MSRYFYERKHTVEEKQRQEYQAQSEPAQWPPHSMQPPNLHNHPCMLQDPPLNSMPAPTVYNYSHQQQLNMHIHAGTGGHYTTVNLNEDLSGTSSFSSSSKRQQINEYGYQQGIRYQQNMLNMLQGMQFLSSSVPLQQRKGGLSPRSQNGAVEQQAQNRCISEECASVDNNFDKENQIAPQEESPKEQPNECAVNLAQEIQDQQSDPHHSSDNSEQKLEIQRVIELTRQLQRNQRQQNQGQQGTTTAAVVQQEQATPACVKAME